VGSLHCLSAAGYAKWSPGSAADVFDLHQTVVPLLPKDIPAVSEWGVVVMTLLVLTAATIVLLRRRGLGCS
jgi:hypothetical protein